VTYPAKNALSRIEVPYAASRTVAKPARINTGSHPDPAAALNLGCTNELRLATVRA
jgi:hypothetical protein